MKVTKTIRSGPLGNAGAHISNPQLTPQQWEIIALAIAYFRVGDANLKTKILSLLNQPNLRSPFVYGMFESLSKQFADNNRKQFADNNRKQFAVHNRKQFAVHNRNQFADSNRNQFADSNRKQFAVHDRRLFFSGCMRSTKPSGYYNTSNSVRGMDNFNIFEPQPKLFLSYFKSAISAAKNRQHANPFALSSIYLILGCLPLSSDKTLLNDIRKISSGKGDSNNLQRALDFIKNHIDEGSGIPPSMITGIKNVLSSLQTPAKQTNSKKTDFQPPTKKRKFVDGNTPAYPAYNNSVCRLPIPTDLFTQGVCSDRIGF